MTDAVVIGAGPNGLSAAITLAGAGREVVLLEASDRLGGAVRTDELTLPGFHHDVFSAVYPAGTASPAFAQYGLERHGLRWIHPRHCLAHVLDGGRAATLSRDLYETAASLDRLHPGDGAAWQALVAPLLEHPRPLRRALLSGFPPVRGPFELSARLGPRRALALARLLPARATTTARRLFESPDARAWLYGTAMHSDVPPTGPGSAIAGVYLNLLGHLVGWPSPEGGAGRLAEALAGALRERGGKARTVARVTRIAVERGRVTGVETAAGDRISASLVVCDLPPGALKELTGDALTGRYASALRRFRHGPPTVKLDWALDGPIPWASAEARAAGTIHAGGDEDELLAGRSPFLLVGQQSIADPTRAPAGKHTAWAYTHPDRGADPQRIAERVEAQVERFAPGFRDLVLARHLLSAADLERRDSNLVGGDVGGGSNALRQLVFRPVARLVPYATPVRGLFLGSASTFPGGGVHGIPGRAAAQAALRQR